jgi:uncharacterized membrane protein
VTEAAEFAGRFHPLLVHFPIALLALAGALELWRAWRRRTAAGDDPTAPAARTNPVTPLVALGAVSALLAAGAGYLLGTRGGYSGPTYDQHFVSGLTLAAIASLAAGASWLRDRSPGRMRLRLARLLLLATMVVLTAASHLGATLTHGDGYLADHAPASIRRLLGLIPARSGGAPPAVPAEQAVVYPTLVAPLLREHCVACHGAAKAEGGLRLDTPDGLRKGGDDGPAIVPSRASASEIVRRVWLPAGHEDAMPPKGRRPLSASDASILRWWVDSGATFDGKLADLEVPGEIVPALEASLGPLSRGGPTIPPVSLAPPAPAALAAIRDRGVFIEPIADASPFLQVRLSGRNEGQDNARVESLRPVARHVLWLDASGTAITDASFDAVAALPHLTRLNISRTATTDAGLAKLSPLAHLEYLNLYGTAVTDAGLAHLAACARLRRLYVWQTAVTPEGVQRLRAALPRVDAFLGAADPPAGVPSPAVSR